MRGGTPTARERRLGACIAVFVAVAPVAARAADGCGAIPWSTKQEQGWFVDKKLPLRQTGARLTRIDRAVKLDLKPLKKVTLFLAPARAAASGTYAGVVTFRGVPKPGVYEVTLSDPAHVDVFENGVRIEPIALASARDCADARVSGRYQLATGDLVLVQVTDVAANSIKVAFTAAPSGPP